MTRMVRVVWIARSDEHGTAARAGKGMIETFVPGEILPGEMRAAATPNTVRRRAKAGFATRVERDARARGFIVECALRSTLVSFLHPSLDPDQVEHLREREMSTRATDAAPRISRTQKMNALSRLFPLPMTAAETIRPERGAILGPATQGNP